MADWFEDGLNLGDRIRGIDLDSVRRKNIISEIADREKARQEKEAAEAKHAKAQQALIDSYADLLPEAEGKKLKAQNQVWGAADREGWLGAQALAAEYAKMDDLKARTAAAKQEREDVAGFYRDLPMQPARRLAGDAVTNGVGGVLDTIQQWSRPAARQPSGEDIRSVVARHPYAGLDPNIARAVVSGFGENADDHPPEEVMLGNVPYVWKRGSREFQPRADFGLNLRQQNALDLITAKQKPEPEPGVAPIISPDKQFYWAGTGWRPIRQDPNAAIVDEMRRARGETNAPAVQTSGSTPGTGRTPEQQAVLDDFAAGKLSRDAAKQKLQALGLK